MLIPLERRWRVLESVDRPMEVHPVAQELPLPGCRPTPLAHYLKALGVFRLVVEQGADPEARAFWRGDTFVLQTALTREELSRFFLTTYRPSGIVAPWNGGSGFFPKDNKKGRKAIEASGEERFATLQAAIRAGEQALAALGLSDKPEKEEKEALLHVCRNRFPDELLSWIESAYVLTGNGAKYPPLLGTGGNDGRLDFTNNFHQRIAEIFDLDGGRNPLDAAALLDEALFREAVAGLTGGAIGQFSPHSAGGANAGSGFEGATAMNPWDFVLMLEGAQLFAAAAVKRLSSLQHGELAYPFCVRMRGVGYGSAAAEDAAASRSELWVPVWERPFSYPELRSVFSEGRVQYNGRPATDGLDFVRAVRTFGVDRGLTAFVRYAFLVRNGLAYFAVPLDRLRVRHEPKVALLLGPLEGWLDAVRSRTSEFSNRMTSAVHQLDQAIYRHSVSADRIRTQELLVALGRTEQALAANPRKAKEKGLRPLPALEPAWVAMSEDPSIEYRLAAALASLYGAYRAPNKTDLERMPIRRHLEPVEIVRSRGYGFHYRFAEHATRDVTWTTGNLIENLLRTFQRRLVLAEKGHLRQLPDSSALSVGTDEIVAFLGGDFNEARFEALLWGLSMVDWPKYIQLQREGREGDEQREINEEEEAGVAFDVQEETLREDEPAPDRSRVTFGFPPYFYSLLKLCFLPERLPLQQEMTKVPLVPAVFRLAESGQGTQAAELALSRLRGSGNVPLMRAVKTDGELARRSAAALLFPLGFRPSLSLVHQVLGRVRPASFPELLQNV